MASWPRDLAWSSEMMSLAELRERHPKLPAVVKIVHGYCGDTDADCLSNEQVLVLHMWIKQSRAIAKNETDRTISIPVNSRQTFDLWTPSKDQENTTDVLISSILKSSSLPVEMTFNPKNQTTFNIGGQNCRSDTFGKLTLLATHKITYAIASTLTDGELEVTDLFSVPTYRQVSLVVASSLSDHQTAALDEHTKKVSELLGKYAENPSSEEFNCLPSIGIVDYREIVGGGVVLGELIDADGGKHDTLSDAVTRFTHYQNLLSSSSPSSQRKAAAREEAAKKRRSASPTPSSKSRDRSLAESILLLQGLSTKMADKPQSSSAKGKSETKESANLENTEGGSSKADATENAKKDGNSDAVASTQL